MSTPITDRGLLKVLEAVGRPVDLARGLSISPQAVAQWRRVPHTRVLEVERLTGVSRHLMRPDLYPEEIVRRALQSPSPIPSPTHGDRPHA